VETKTCPKCGEEKPTDDFYFQRRACKPCVREDQRRFRDSQPDYNHARNLQRRYGLSVDEYQTLLANQNFACPICEVEISNTIAYKGKRPVAVDHNHDTGDVRGILCSMCNLMLGHARENTSILYRAIVYLSERGAYASKK
jgi:hypothetical protein